MGDGQVVVQAAGRRAAAAVATREAVRSAVAVT
jgi:hypothetical protein